MSKSSVICGKFVKISKFVNFCQRRYACMVHFDTTHPSGSISPISSAQYRARRPWLEQTPTRPCGAVAWGVARQALRRSSCQEVSSAQRSRLRLDGCERVADCSAKSLSGFIRDVSDFVANTQRCRLHTNPTNWTKLDFSLKV